MIIILEVSISSSSTQESKELLSINQENKRYVLFIETKGESITLTCLDLEDKESLPFIKTMTLKEIKEKEEHNLFFGLNSCNEFSKYLKALSEANKLSIIIKEDKISINFIVEYLLKKHKVEIDLFPEILNLNSVNREIILLKGKFQILLENNQKSENENKELKNEIENLKKENISLKEEIMELKNLIEPINIKFNENENINKYIFNKKSVIMKENEFDLIHLAIKSRLNKEIMALNKLYQAFIDGDRAINFHSKCDNVPNTLVVIKSAGNRRFGGFTTQIWESSEHKYKDDKNAFLFSLDKQKIYSYKNVGEAICTNKTNGPSFGGGYDIYIGNNPIQIKNSYTYEIGNYSYNYSGDNNALSEDGKANCIYLSDYEVFEVIFL